MIKATESSLNNINVAREVVQNAVQTNIRECPSCGELTLKGMPGGRDAVCKICGYKDPCCYD